MFKYSAELTAEEIYEGLVMVADIHIEENDLDEERTYH